MTIFVDEIAPLTVEAYKIDPTQNLGFLGPVGIGKTEVTFEARDILRQIYGPDFFMEVGILSQMSAEDFMIPWPEPEMAKKGIYKHLTHGDWVYPEDARGIKFLDEALNGSADVLKATQNLLSSRMLNGKSLPPGVMIVICSNRKEDRAGVGTTNSAFANRVEWHDVEIHFDAWERWARRNGIDTTIITFLKKFKQHLYDFKPDRLINATPRTWAKVNKVLGSKWEFQRVSGLVGEGIANEYTAYKRLFGEFPEIDEIKAAPKRARVPQSKDAQFALASALAMWNTRDLWPSFVSYVERMDQEYKFMFMREAARIHTDQGLKTTQEWKNYILTNQKDLI